MPTNCATLLRNSWSRPWVTRPITAARRSRDTSATPGRQATTEAMPRIATCCASSAVAIFFMESPSTAATVRIAARSSLRVGLLIVFVLSLGFAVIRRARPVWPNPPRWFRSVDAGDVVAEIDEAVLDVAADALDAIENRAGEILDAVAEALELVQLISRGRIEPTLDLVHADADIGKALENRLTRV